MMDKLSEHFSFDGKYITNISDNKLNVVDLTNNKIVFTVKDENDLVSIRMDNYKNVLYMLYQNGDLYMFDIESGINMKISSIGVSGRIKQFDENQLIIAGENDEVLLFDLETNSKIASIYTNKGEDFSVITPDNYYYSTLGSIKNITFKTLKNVYSFEQFDLFFNRPHEVMSQIKSSNTDLQNTYKKAWEKRISVSGLENIDVKSLNIPKIKIDKTNIPLNAYSPDLKISVDMTENNEIISKLNVWINNVPVYGKSGKKTVASLKADIDLQLNQGKNTIEVSCTNAVGVESLKETIEVNCILRESHKPNFYLVVISTSEYQQSQMNLKYAVKDGRDLALLFSESNDFESIYIDTLFDQDATKENIINIKEKLLHSNVDDQVILFVSGHGLLDDNYDFYFATHDIDFDNPAERGVSYDQLEWLLDSIPARKKLFMMDACHSGEVDKEELIAFNDLKEQEGLKSGIKSYTYRAKVLQGEEDKGIGLQNSFELMQELFTNLNRGSGAVVISAAAGDSYALESDEWNNGVFTYSVLDGLKNQKADLNKNGEITVSELRDYVSEKVQQETGGRQKPTVRQENVEFDFRVW